MKKEVKDALNTLKMFLGMEVKLEQMMLVDGVTTIEFDALEVGQNVSIVNEEDRIPLPIGEYELQDGQLLKVLEDGIIGEIGAKQEEVEEPETPEVEEEVEMETEKPVAKKVVESTVKETHFSKEEKENLEKKIEELKAKITELSKVEEKVEEVEEVKVELSDEEVKPITFNPENKQQIEVVKLGKGNSKISNILEQVYKFK
jgi:hypothetical protein